MKNASFLLCACILLGACKKDEASRSVEYRASCYSCTLSYRASDGDYMRNVVLDTVWTDTGYRRASWSASADIPESVSPRISLMNDGQTDLYRRDTCEAYITVDGATVRSQRITSIGGNIDLAY